MKAMNARALLVWFLPLLSLLLLTGCKSGKDEGIVTPPGTLGDQSEDTSFRAFLSRLRKAVERRDVETLAGMMAVNFGYSWEPGGEGPGVFDYWDRHQLWREVRAVLDEPFVVSGDYMVSPPAVAHDPDYAGYRAGLRLVNGSWRFAYFVPAPPQ